MVNHICSCWMANLCVYQIVWQTRGCKANFNFSPILRSSRLFPFPSLALASRGCAVARQALEIGGSPIGSLGVNEILLSDLGVICRYMWIYIYIYSFFWFIYLLLYLFVFYVLIYLCFYVFIYSFMYLFVYLFYLFVYWFILFVALICLSIDLSMHLYIYFFPLPYAVHAERRDSSSCGCRLPEKLLTSTYNTGPDGFV